MRSQTATANQQNDSQPFSALLDDATTPATVSAQPSSPQPAQRDQISPTGSVTPAAQSSATAAAAKATATAAAATTTAAASASGAAAVNIRTNLNLAVVLNHSAKADARNATDADPLAAAPDDAQSNGADVGAPTAPAGGPGQTQVDAAGATAAAAGQAGTSVEDPANDPAGDATAAAVAAAAAAAALGAPAAESGGLATKAAAADTTPVKDDKSRSASADPAAATATQGTPAADPSPPIAAIVVLQVLADPAPVKSSGTALPPVSAAPSGSRPATGTAVLAGGADLPPAQAGNATSSAAAAGNSSAATSGGPGPAATANTAQAASSAARVVAPAMAPNLLAPAGATPSKSDAGTSSAAGHGSSGSDANAATTAVSSVGPPGAAAPAAGADAQSQSQTQTQTQTQTDPNTGTPAPAPAPAIGAASSPTDRAAQRADASATPAIAGAPTAHAAAGAGNVLSNFGVLPPTQGTIVSNPAAANAAAVPIAGLAVAIVARAKAGNNQFDIRLDPPELGRIDVRLDIDGSGQLTTHVTAERSDTLQLLQSQQPQLERAFEQAGLKTADNGLQFSLRDQSFAGQNGGSQPNTARLIVSDSELAPVDVAHVYSRLNRGGGLDIRV